MHMSELSEPSVRDALSKTAGNLAIASRLLGVTRGALAAWVAQRPELQAALDDSRQELADHAETALRLAVSQKLSWAVCFALKTLGKQRGYVDRGATADP